MKLVLLSHYYVTVTEVKSYLSEMVTTGLGRIGDDLGAKADVFSHRSSHP